MGLLNVYAFSNEILPVLSNRFNVTFYYADNQNTQIDEIFSTFCVKDVKLPTWSMESNNTRTRFGNTQYVIPTFNFANSILEITFIENDDMTCYNTMSNIMFNNTMWDTISSKTIKIKIDEMNYSLTDIISSHIYFVKMKAITQPTWSNSSNASIVEFSTTFNVLYETNVLDSLTFASIITERNEMSKFDENHANTRRKKAGNEELLLTSAYEETRKSIKEQKPLQKPIELSSNNEQKLKNIFDKVQNNLGGRTKDTFENWKNRFISEHITTDNVDDILTKLDQTVEKTINLNKLLSEKGYKVRLAGTNDLYGALLGKHSANSDHNNGLKVDLQILDNKGNVIDLKNEQNQEKVLNVLKSIQKDAGLHTYIVEFNSKSEGFGWLDINYTRSDWKGIAGGGKYDVAK